MNLLREMDREFTLILKLIQLYNTYLNPTRAVCSCSDSSMFISEELIIMFAPTQGRTYKGFQSQTARTHSRCNNPMQIISSQVKILL